MKIASLSIEVALPQPGDKEFESFVEKVAEAVLKRVSTKLQDKPKPDESTPLE
ncbi:hypothetical protein [Pseudomonas kitaguniensis]|uniref:hypothetical protein n=1 Tax=Pseudomonas kitaguniensis TaxID=2607908 RepID=UPI00156219D1|nr:hypothetical protein [Pseudomonas kitaguniensis]